METVSGNVQLELNEMRYVNSNCDTRHDGSCGISFWFTIRSQPEPSPYSEVCCKSRDVDILKNSMNNIFDFWVVLK